MIVYLDTSVLLRFVLNQPRKLSEWNEITEGMTSRLARVESFRTVDRMQKVGLLSAEPADLAREYATALLSRLTLLPFDEETLTRAANPFPTPLGTLDAIHLATALLYRAAQPKDEPPIRFATHDGALAVAARAVEFRVLGA